LLAASDLNQYLGEISAASEPSSHETARFDILLRELAFLNAMLTSDPQRKTILLVRALVGPPDDAPSVVRDFYLQAGAVFHPYFTGSNESIEAAFLPGWIDHPEGSILLPDEAGIHLVVRTAQQLIPVEAITVSLAVGDDPAQAATQAISQRVLTAHTPSSAAILRLYEDNIIDLRTGLIADRSNASTQYRDILIAQCPLPPELRA
jgi:hypothetical protein